MSVIKGAENLPRAVSVNASFDTSSELVKYLRRKLSELGYYTVFNGLIERPNHVNVFVIDLDGKSAEGRPMYENGIPILYYNTSSEVAEVTADDLVDSANDEGSDAEDSGSDTEDSESDAEASDDGSGSDEESGGSDEEETKTVTKETDKKPSNDNKKPSNDDKELRKTARAIADAIKNMHIANKKADLVQKIHQLGDVTVAKAYTRNVFNSSNKFKSDADRAACTEGINNVTLDLVFLDVARTMPPISSAR